MSSILVFQASPEINLTPITDRLWQAKIPHRVVMNNGTQDLWVARIEDAEQVKIWVQQWQAGELSAKPDAAEKTPWQVGMHQNAIALSRIPVTVMLMVILWSIFAAQQVGLVLQIDWLLDPLLWSGEKLDFNSFWHNDLYRWWSPALIHLSLMHIVMNSFWWWVLAKEVELHDGHGGLILLTLALALGAGFAQYLAVGPYFAGLSGVTYGLMGWVWGRQHRYRDAATPRYNLPSWLFPFMMVFMVIMIMFDSVFGDSNVGHESHVAGALLGVLMAMMWPISNIHNDPEKIEKELEGKSDDS
jgi:GlpG protein